MKTIEEKSRPIETLGGDQLIKTGGLSLTVGVKR